MTIHRQAWVKVNTQVDRGIAALIEALSIFPELRTLESCEGTEDSAWVCFDWGEEGDKDLVKFVLEVAGPALMAEFGDRLNLNVTVTESGAKRAEMTVSKSIIPAVSKALKQLSRSAKAA